MKRHVARLCWSIVLLVALGTLVAPAGAKQPTRIPRVGVLATSENIGTTAAFRRGLRDLGYVEGENISVEYRFNEGVGNRLPTLAAELVGLQPDIIVAIGAVHAQALKAATTSIPIGFAIVPDAVDIGLVDDNERPGGNLTGFSVFDPDEYTKQLLILKEIVPGLRRVAFFADEDVADLVRGGEFPIGQKEADAVGLELQGVGLRSANLDLEAAFAAARRGGAQAVLVLQQPVTGVNRQAIAEMALRERLPTLFWGDVADDVWLAASGSGLGGAAYRVASYMDRILGGEAAGDLPVGSAVSDTLTINLDTARTLGLTIPIAVLQRADRVIDSRGK
jgi:putative ABC transport system substrate-binding protein